MKQIEMMTVRRGTENGVRDFLIPECEVCVGDTVLLFGFSRAGHRLTFAHDPKPLSDIPVETRDGIVMEVRGQRCRFEDGLALPLADPARPYGDVLTHGAMVINASEPVRLMKLTPVSSITGELR